MKRRLLALNILLLGGLGLFGWQFRQKWLATRAHEEKVLNQKLNVPKPPPTVPSKPAAPLTPTTYIDVAQKMLFARDRNPNVIIDPPAPAPVKPVPPFPEAHGVMLFGEAPTILLSERSGAKQHGYHPGDKIGEFQLVSFNNQQIVFAWDGKQLVKRLDELVPKNVPVQEAAAPVAAPAAAAKSGMTSLSASANTGPGVSMGGEVRACQADDNAPPGTMKDGLRKVVSETPFGKVCRWEPAK